MMTGVHPLSRISRLLWITLGAAAGLGLLAIWLAAAALGRGRAGSAAPAPLVTVIPYSTSTPIPTPVPTLPPETSAPATPGGSNPSGAGLRSGMLVAISGTEGDGLRLRSLPGVAASVNLVALESEVFEIREGPVEVGDRMWWYLVNPYDSSKYGWGASEYLVSAGSP